MVVYNMTTRKQHTQRLTLSMYDVLLSLTCPRIVWYVFVDMQHYNDGDLLDIALYRCYYRWLQYHDDSVVSSSLILYSDNIPTEWKVVMPSIDTATVSLFFYCMYDIWYEMLCLCCSWIKQKRWWVVSARESEWWMSTSTSWQRLTGSGSVSSSLWVEREMKFCLIWSWYRTVKTLVPINDIVPRYFLEPAKNTANFLWRWM